MRPVSPTRDRTPTITAVVRDAESALTARDMEVYIDGRAAAGHKYSGNKLSYAPKKALKKGTQAARIVATDGQRKSAAKAWRFVVR